MKIVKVKDIPLETLRPHLEEAIKMAEEFFRSYGSETDSLVTASQLSYLLWVSKGKLEGKRILDLGCGSTNDFEGRDLGLNTRKLEEIIGYPWLCRTLEYHGAKVLGVDIGDNSSEKFRSLRLDLSIPDSLKELPDNSFHIAHSANFVDSPYLKRQGITPKKIHQILRPQLERVVEDEGTYIWFG